MSLIIGIVGENGGGKDSFAKAIAAHRTDLSVEAFKSSDILLETLNIWNIPASRKDFQALAVAMENTFGKGVLSRAMDARMRASKAAVVIFNGVRWESDVEVVRAFEHHMLVYVTAESELRFEHLRGRGEKIDEVGMSYEQFLQEEQAKTEAMIPQIGATADVKIENNGTFEAFLGQARSFCDQFLTNDKIT
ncbi:hypothetical protein HZC00_00115 [Candidatus Kaiserbacteria bacterium]|nr:hypothetical protein [Candidatus Kaiserbacteria bacterium]